MTTPRPKAERHPGGRPTKLTKDVSAPFIALIAAGNHIEPSCRAAGISKHTLYAWLRRGEAARKGIYREFLDSFRKAAAMAEVWHVKNVKDGAKRDPRLSLEFLARRYPKRWSPPERKKVEHTGKNGGPIQMNSFADLFEQAAKAELDEAEEPGAPIAESDPSSSTNGH
jgi:hypothetical protein